MIRFLSATLGAMLGLLLLQPLPAGAQQRQLKMGTFSASNSPWADGMREFSRIVKEKTENRINVSVYTDAQLGDMQQLLTGMQLGTIDMAYFDVTVAAFLKGGEALMVCIVPYLFDSKENTGKILNSELFQPLYEDVAKKTGVRIFAVYGDRSPRAIQSTKGPIMKPEDLKGLRFRVPGIDVYKRTFETLGVKVTPMGMTDIYNALSRGIVDGQDNGIDVSVPLKFHEAAKHWSATDHAYSITGWFISDKLWTAFSDTDRAIMIDAAKQGGMLTSKATEKLEAEAENILKQAGVTYVVPDRAAFREALSKLHLEFEGKVWPAGMVAKIRAMQGH
jgi:tripartite ATP-independent transporter DctP family solute receptor